MNYELADGQRRDKVKEKGEGFKGDRLGFAKYMYTVIRSIGRIQNHSSEHRNAMWGDNFDCGDSTIIGGSGFGFAKNEDGTWLEIPHIGWVVISDNVRIGSNCCIDRGTIGSTYIGDGTKIDNMVHIAHNCKIGKNVIICAGVTFCGSVTVEDDVWLAPGTLIKEGVTIGKGAKTGLGAVVIEDVKPGALVYGCPAKEKA